VYPSRAPAPLATRPLEVLLVADVAAELRVSQATVYKICACGQLAHFRVAGALRIRREDLEAYVKSSRGAE
jgi:excisionase family DNA binding protein